MSSRRDFIRTVLLASGAVYGVSLVGCGRTKEQPRVERVEPARRITGQRHAVAHTYLMSGAPLESPSRLQTADVVIVGTGLSGLAAAHFLREEGLAVSMLETEPRPGGAGVSDPINGRPVALGSVYFVDRTPELDALIKAAGIEAVSCKDDAVHLRGAVYHDFWSDAELRQASGTDAEYDGIRRFRDDLIAMGDDVPSYPLPEYLPSRWRRFDRMSALDYVDHYASPLLRDVLDAYSRSSMGASLAETNAYCLLNFYSSEFGRSFGTERLGFAGGIGSLTSRLAERHDMRTDELVARVERRGRGVRVSSVRPDGTVTVTDARVAILAVPKYVAARMIQSMPTAQREAIASFRYAPYATVHVRSSRRLLDGDAYDTWHLPATDLYTDVIDPTSIPGAEKGPHVASIYAPMRTSERRVLMTDDVFADRIAQIVSRFTDVVGGDAAERVEEIVAWAWGHGIVIPVPGSHSGMAQRARRDVGPFILAGTDNDAAPAVENAVENGASAARRAIARLRS